MSTLSISPSFTTRRPAQLTAERTAERPPVRLTRRGRLVVFLVALTAMLCVAFFAGSVAVGSAEAGQAPATEIIQVSPGDTLWGIAADLTTDGDVRATMREIEDLNALDTVTLSAGQRLRVPAVAD